MVIIVSILCSILNLWGKKNKTTTFKQQLIFISVPICRQTPLTCCPMGARRAEPATTASSSLAEWCYPCGPPTSLSHWPTTAPSDWQREGRREIYGGLMERKNVGKPGSGNSAFRESANKRDVGSVVWYSTVKDLNVWKVGLAFVREGGKADRGFVSSHFPH